MIVVNFKAYRNAVGEKSEEIIEACKKASNETGEQVIVCPQQADLLRVDGVESFAQHLDGINPGSHTGKILAKSIAESGATGTLLNHSENRMRDRAIEASINAAQSHDLETIVCARSPTECEKYSRFKPDYIAFEPPELIGNDVAVSEARPDLIQEAVSRCRGVPTLTGAGIKSKEDVEKSIELGCEGVLVASGVVKANDKYSEVKELCEGL